MSLCFLFFLGSIRVYRRVRPFLPGQSNYQSTVDYIGEDGQIMIANPAKQGKDIRKSFTFNKVFGGSATHSLFRVLKTFYMIVRCNLLNHNIIHVELQRKSFWIPGH